MTQVGASRGPVARGSVARVGTATAVTALCGYAVIYAAARDLAPNGFAVFGVFWGAFGLVTGAANGLLQETTREVRAARYIDVRPGERTHPLRVAAQVGLAAAVLIAGTSPLWGGRVFVEARWLSVALLSAGLAGFCLHATLLGMLAGLDQWTQYGALMVTDAVIRVALAAAAFLMGWGLAGFLWATVAGAVAWLLVLVASPAARAAARLLTPGGTITFLRGAAHSITAAGASAILVMGFPVLLKLTSGALGAQGGVIILAVTLTRAPLLVPLTAMQGNLIAHFVDERSDRLRALIAPAGVVGGIGAIGVVAAGAVGPWLLRFGFGAQYQAGGALLAWLTGAAVAIAMLTLTGAAAVAAALHRAYALGWVAATVASGLFLLLPLPLQARTVVGLLCGPLVGIGVHLLALARAGRFSGETVTAVYLVGIEMHYPDVWIVIPAFNEAPVIGEVVADLRAVFEHVVCVDDGSSDGSGEIARRAGAHLVRHPVNLGQGAAIQTGVEYARRQPGARVFATFDADGQHRVKDVAAMVDRLGAGDVDIVIGTRFGGQEGSRPPLLKRLVLRTAARLSRRGRRLGLTDTNNGLRVFNKKVADALDITMSGMSHANEFVVLIAQHGWRVAEYPVEVLYTEYSKSKGQPLLNGVNIIFDGFLRGRIPR